MIAEREKNFDVSGNVTGEGVPMGIDKNAMAHIMNILTDLYSDRELAVIREYSTNAFDAHIEAGIKKPIEVTTPTPLAPMFKVEDHGVGLTADDIREIYSQYGASTKRATNDQVGMLGLGCKSALTYTSQFTVTSIKDGRMITVLIRRNDEGAGEMLLQADVPTDKPNGTTVIVPADRHNSFESKARTFFSYWEDGTVLLNGEEPEKLEGLDLGNGLTVVSESGRNRIVMGHVAYPWSPDVGLGYNYSLVARVPIGAVNFAPSREALMDTGTTTETLKKIRDDFNERASKAVQKAIDAAASPGEAIRTMIEWQGMFPRHLRQGNGYTYKGRTIPTGFDNLDATVAPFDPSQVTRNSKMKSLNIDYFTQSIFVTGYTLQKFTATHKKKLNQWAVNEKQTFGDGKHWRSYVLLDKLPADRAEWLTAEQVIDWDDVNAIKLPRNAPSTTSGRIPGSYDACVKGTFKHGVPANDIDQNHEVLYFPRSHRDGYYIREVIHDLYPNATLVFMASNRVDKFRRHFPQAEHAIEAIRAHYRKWWAKVQPETKLALRMHASTSYYGSHYNKPGIAYIDPTKVSDPDLAKYAKIAKKDLTSVIERRKVYEDALGRLRDDLDKIKVPDVLAEYPLYNGDTLRRGGKPADHMYAYLNAAYRLRQDGKL